MKANLVIFSICLSLFAVDCRRKYFLGKIFYNLEDSFEGEEQTTERADESTKVEEKWFAQQKLNHFEPQDQRIWKQRYFTHNQFFDSNDPNAPVFLEISGEGRANAEKFRISNMASNLAKVFKAYSIQLEHRFYGESQPFKFFTDMCKDIYGPKFNVDYIKRAIKRTIMIYGGRNLKADKVFPLNGSNDPWHVLGLLKYRYLDTSTYFINGTAHCADMYPQKKDDKPDLTVARALIKQNIHLFNLTKISY